MLGKSQLSLHRSLFSGKSSLTIKQENQTQPQHLSHGAVQRDTAASSRRPWYPRPSLLALHIRGFPPCPSWVPAPCLSPPARTAPACSPSALLRPTSPPASSRGPPFPSFYWHFVHKEIKTWLVGGVECRARGCSAPLPATRLVFHPPVFAKAN